MKLTLNLYDNGNLPIDAIKQRIIDKDPIIFIIPRGMAGAIFPAVNAADEFKKSMYILESFNIARAFSYLFSFVNILDKRIMIMAPKHRDEEAKSLAVNIYRLCEQYGMSSNKKNNLIRQHNRNNNQNNRHGNIIM